jgi:hypothetical protein
MYIYGTGFRGPGSAAYSSVKYFFLTTTAVTGRHMLQSPQSVTKRRHVLFVSLLLFNGKSRRQGSPGPHQSQSPRTPSHPSRYRWQPTRRSRNPRLSSATCMSRTATEHIHEPLTTGALQEYKDTNDRNSSQTGAGTVAGSEVSARQLAVVARNVHAANMPVADNNVGARALAVADVEHGA